MGKEGPGAQPVPGKKAEPRTKAAKVNLNVVVSCERCGALFIKTMGKCPVCRRPLEG